MRRIDYNIDLFRSLSALSQARYTSKFKGGIIMAKEVVPIEVLEGEASRLRAMQSEYEEITKRIVPFLHSTAELHVCQNHILGHILEFENVTQRSTQILEGLSLSMQASIEIVRQLNKECLYASPRANSIMDSFR